MSQLINPEISQLNFTKINQQQGNKTERTNNPNINGLATMSNIGYNLYSQQVIINQQVSTNRTTRFQNKFSFKKDTGTQYLKGKQIIIQSGTHQSVQRQISQNHNTVNANPLLTFRRPQTVDKTFVIPVEQGRNNPNNFNLQIRELQSKIQILQGQKLTLTEKIRYFEEINAFFHKKLLQKIEEYRHEVQNLRTKNRELSQLYENQNSLLNKENIILKENSSKYMEQIDVVKREKLIFVELLNEKQSSYFGLQHKLDLMENQKHKNTEYFKEKQLQINRLSAALNNANISVKRLQNQKLAHKQKHIIEEIHHREKYNELLIQYGKSHLQTIVLLSEINRLGIQFKQTQQYLQITKQQIVQLRESLSKHKIQLQDIKINKKSSQLINNSNTITELKQTIYQLQKSLQQLQNQYHLVVRERDELSNKSTASQIDYKQINQLQSSLQISEMTIKQYEQQISRLKLYCQQLQQNNSNLAIERDQFLLKISSLLSNLQQKVQVPMQYEEDRRLLQFQEQIRQLNLQLQATEEKLKIAEIYIFQNQNSWNEIKRIQEEESGLRQRQIIELLNNIEYLKQQNQELLQKIENQKNVVEENNFLRGENQRLQEVINRYQSNQIQSQNEYENILHTLRQVEEHLKSGNAQESQQEINKLRMQVQTLTNQVNYLKKQTNRLVEVEEHLKKAEAYIFEREEKIQQMFRIYQDQIVSLKDHMQKAQLQIIRLQVLYQPNGDNLNKQSNGNK